MKINFLSLFETKIAHANESLGKMKEVAGNGGFAVDGVDSFSLSKSLGLLINVFFSVLGLIFIILLLIAGYNYMMAQGDTTKTSTALKSIRHAVVGLILIIGSYAIWWLIFTSLTGFQN